MIGLIYIGVGWMQDLIIELRGLQNKLNISVKELKSTGVKKAKAEAEYRVKLVEKILLERDRVMAVTIINDVCRGDREIARLKLERDINEVLYDSCRESIYATKLEMNIIRDLIKGERLEE